MHLVLHFIRIKPARGKNRNKQLCATAQQPSFLAFIPESLETFINQPAGLLTYSIESAFPQQYVATVAIDGFQT
jgi:hypothetical protein